MDRFGNCTQMFSLQSAKDMSCFIYCYTDCHFAERCYAESHVLFIATVNIIRLNVVRLSIMFYLLSY